MDAENDLADLRRRVQLIEDRTAILDCVNRHARGHDRHDVEMLTSTYHEDGVDEHGAAINVGAAYAEWANATHAATSQTHLHNITTHTCEIDGDTAHAESYVIVVLVSPDGRHTQFINGRYVDRLERRDGEWRIALRRATVEAMFASDSSILNAPFFKDLGYVKGARDTSDLSYARPLQLETESTRW